ncbi:hypothetical protein N6P31_07265 [Pectobacterium betavasculorum]|uniref:hypothetical protein n=1 Tax=Pectobacterium betavasculorum TaxID=55207 RepID=UPI0012E0285D|nr:hypothetical protein [Pectobacterium betavasculorum]
MKILFMLIIRTVINSDISVILQAACALATRLSTLAVCLAPLGPLQQPSNLPTADLSLTEGQPLAGQIRSRRICPSLAAFLQLELFGVYVFDDKSKKSPTPKVHQA